MTPPTRAPTRAPPSKGWGVSDVDELVEVLHQVLDQARPAICHLRADPRHEREEGDRRDHQPPGPVAPDHGGRAATRSEHAFVFGLAQVGRGPEVIDDSDDAPT